jgi:hypothetical protein
MVRLIVGSLCSGIGGLDMALEALGMEVVWSVENDPFCLKVLKQHWPSIPRYGDLKQLTSSLEASRVRAIPPLASLEERMTKEISGPRSSPLFCIYNPASSSWRTSAISLLSTTLEPYSGDWPTQGTMRNGVCFQRQKSVRLTRGTGYSSWPTPDTVNPGDGQPYEKLQASLEERRARTKQAVAEGRVKPGSGRSENLAMAVAKQNWMTPNTMDSLPAKSQEALDYEHYRTRLGRLTPNNLRDQVAVQQGARKWPTPDANASTYSNGERGPNLREKASHWMTPNTGLYGPQAPRTPMPGDTSSSVGPNSPRRLNPLFVEWLMGLPIGHTVLRPSETPSSPPQPCSPS